MYDQSNVPKQFRVEYKSGIKDLKAGEHYTDSISKYTVLSTLGSEKEILVVNWTKHEVVNTGKDSILRDLNMRGVEKISLGFDFVNDSRFPIHYYESDLDNFVLINVSGSLHHGLCTVLDLGKWTAKTQTNWDVYKKLSNGNWKMCEVVVK